MNRRVALTLALIAGLATVSSEAGIWQNAFQGLDLLATPSGSPVFPSADGTRINGARSGRVRIVPNGVLGDGYRLEFDRTFGADSHGRPETLRFGGLGELTLSGSTQFTAGYEDFASKFKTGFADLSISNLTYALKTTNGAEDVKLTGTLNVAGNLRINQLGFYDVTLQVSNSNSTATVNGIATDQTESTNFDVGPIVIQGNIFADAAVSLLAALGVDTSQYSTLFPKSPADQITAAIQDNLQSASAAANGTAVAGATDENPLAPLLLQTVLGGNQDAAAALTQGLVDGSLHGDSSGRTTPTAPLPEPGTLVLLILGTAPFWRRVLRGPRAAR
jgi:hypothetical protein